jgi:hypothetical protein
VSMISENSPLTARQGVTIVARFVCLLLVWYAVLNLIEIPSYLAGVLHYHTPSEGPAIGNYYAYWTAKYIGFVGGALFRAAVELYLARVFYRCGPRVTKFLLGDDLTPPDPQAEA